MAGEWSALFMETQDAIRLRLFQLQPYVDEAKLLETMLSIIDYKVESTRTILSTKQMIERLVLATDYDEIIFNKDITGPVGCASSTATRNLKRLVSEGVLEKFGRGYRRVPD